MDDRKFRILQAIIDDYILTAEPVGSRTISKKYDMGLSSATIRNEMSDLEELGYLDQPHVSAGRIPSAKAYRLYVDALLQNGKIPSADESSIRNHFQGRSRQMEEVMEQAAQVLSSVTQYTAVVLSPNEQSPVLRNIQLVRVGSRSSLVVIVTDGGVVRDQVITYPESMDEDTLYHISRFLSESLCGCTLQQACERMPELIRHMGQNGTVLEQLGSYFADKRESGHHVRIAVGGASNMLTYPEYADMHKARMFLNLVETRDKLASIISQHGSVSMTVRIGPETGIPEMEDCSIVTATYSTQAGKHGTIGVIGPTRMQYSRVLSVLSAMGQQLTELLGEDGLNEERS